MELHHKAPTAVIVAVIVRRILRYVLLWDRNCGRTLRAILRGQVPLASKAAVGNLNITPTHGSIVATSLTKFAMGSRSAPVWSKPEARSGARSYGIESDAIICSLPRW